MQQIACNIAHNVAGVEASSTSATFHATIASCVRSLTVATCGERAYHKQRMHVLYGHMCELDKFGRNSECIFIFTCL